MAGLMIAIANSISSNYVASAGGGYDPDAEAFIIATGISGSNANAINELVLDLKGANIWTKFNALYPIIGGTSTTHKFNLKNPADTNAAFRLSFSGGWTHSANGALPNGINAYADTFLTPSSHLSLNSAHLSFYSRTNSTGTYADIGSGNNSTNIGYTQILSKWSDNKFYAQINDNDFSDNIVSDSLGLFIGSRLSSTNVKTFKNNTIITTKTTATSTFLTSLSIWISARNLQNIGGGNNYSNRQCAFASIGSGLTDLESQLFYQIVEKYQVALSRNINPTQSFYYNRNYGNEANAYLFSTQIADTTQQVALNTLVSDMKTYGIWSKMRAVYPIMGTTATQQKFNLVNPQDTDAAFRLTFNGGWTHASTGMTPNGINAYADTFITPSTHLSLNNTHLSYYSRTDVAANTHQMGCSQLTAEAQYLTLITRYAANLAYYAVNVSQTNAGGTSVSNSDSRGFFIASRTASNVITGFRNSTKQLNGTTNSSILPNSKIYLGAINNSGTASAYSTNLCAFASIGDGLTDTEAANFYTAVQNFQTTLGRQV